jgi:hypothetical protein
MFDLNYGIRLKLSSDNRFDLLEVLAPIGEELIRKLAWKVQMESFVIHYESEFAQNSEFIAPIGDGYLECRTARRPWSYEQLARFSRERHQVIDGEFIGYKATPKGKKKWVVLIAFDSSWWDVWSGNPAVIDKVSAVFPWAEKISPSAT